MLTNTQVITQIYRQSSVQSCFGEIQKCAFLSDKQQHSEMDVGRERSTWGEYLHSMTVREYPWFLICPFSHVVLLTTPTLCEVWKSAAIHLIHPNVQLVVMLSPPSAMTPLPQTHTAWHFSGTVSWSTNPWHLSEKYCKNKLFRRFVCVLHLGTKNIPAILVETHRNYVSQICQQIIMTYYSF